MKKSYIYIGILFLLATGCKKESKFTTFKKFPETIKLTGKETRLKPNFKVAYLDLYENKLIIHLTTHNDKLVHIYNKKSLNHIISIAKKGRGPNEIKKPGSTVIENNGKILINDWGRHYLIGYHIDSLIKGKNQTHKIIGKTPVAVFPSFNFSQIYDSLFLYTTHNPGYYFYCANKKGKIIDSLNIKNKTNIYPNLNRNNILFTTWYHYAIHPSEKKIILAYMYTDIIVGIDFKGNILFQCQGPDVFQEEPTAKNLMSKDVQIAFESVKADEKYIYCKYNGKSKLVNKENNEITANYGESLLVYNWEGKPILRIDLDHPFLDFVIDRNNKKIITYTSDLGQIFTYKLPELLWE